MDEVTAVLGAYSRPDRDHTDPLQTLGAGSSAFGRGPWTQPGTDRAYCYIGISNGIESYVLVDGCTETVV
jgi:hypothetical protein